MTSFIILTQTSKENVVVFSIAQFRTVNGMKPSVPPEFYKINFNKRPSHFFILF